MRADACSVCRRPLLRVVRRALCGSAVVLPRVAAPGARCGSPPRSQSGLTRPTAAAGKKNREALHGLLLKELKAMPPSVFRDRGFASAKAYVKTRVMPTAGAQIIGTRPMLWTSLCKCRNPSALRPETRASALELLAGGQLLHALGRLDGAVVREMLSEFLVDLRALLQADKVSRYPLARRPPSAGHRSRIPPAPHPCRRRVSA